MKLTKAEYLYKCLKLHIEFHFKGFAIEAFKNSKIEFVDWSELCSTSNIEPNTIYIPLTNIPQTDMRPREVEFLGRQFSIWGFLPSPGAIWDYSSESRAWFKCSNGAFTPTWDAGNIIFNLITLQEEKEIISDDLFDRILGRMSPRYAAGLLRTPIFNIFAALLVQLCVSIYDPKNSKRPLTHGLKVCLSHDLDQLRGDDFWTQSSRLWRYIEPLTRGRRPDISQLSEILLNFQYPRLNYIDDLKNMLAVERSYGFNSINYVLTGTRGRFGARTRFRFLHACINEILGKSALGIHYNTDTHLNTTQFKKQKKIIEEMINEKIIAGRAHYLVFNHEYSFDFWQQNKIHIDETLGYPDQVGFRSGIAGAYLPYDESFSEPKKIVALPLIAMDSAIQATYGDQYLYNIRKVFEDLKILGGTMTILFHPGIFQDQKNKSFAKMYEEILAILDQLGATSVLPDDIAKIYLTSAIMKAN